MISGVRLLLGACRHSFWLRDLVHLNYWNVLCKKKLRDIKYHDKKGKGPIKLDPAKIWITYHFMPGNLSFYAW